jgi:hypothetical protein
MWQLFPKTLANLVPKKLSWKMKLSHTFQKTFVENTRKIVEKNSFIGCLEK